MSTPVLAPIVLDDRGVAYIEGTRIKVTYLAALQQAEGLTPEQLQEELPHLTLGQIYAALGHYHLNREALDAEIRAGLERADRWRTEAGESEFAQRMRREGRLG